MSETTICVPYREYRYLQNAVNGWRKGDPQASAEVIRHLAGILVDRVDARDYMETPA